VDDYIEPRIARATHEGRQRIDPRSAVPPALGEIEIEHLDLLRRETDELVDCRDLCGHGLEALFARRNRRRGRLVVVRR